MVETKVVPMKTVYSEVCGLGYCFLEDVAVEFFNTFRATNKNPCISIVLGCRQTSQRLPFLKAEQTKPKLSDDWIRSSKQGHILFLWCGWTKWWRHNLVNCSLLGFVHRGTEAKITDISERFLDITITGHLLLLMLSLRTYEGWILRNEWSWCR